MRIDVLALIFAFSLIVSGASAETYKLFGLQNYPPYSFVDDGKNRGIDVDVAREAFSRAGHGLKIEFVPWKRLLNSAKAGHVDGTLGAFITPEREQYLDFIKSEPLRWINMAMFASQDAVIVDTTVNGLRGKLIAVNRGFAINPAFDSAARSGFLSIYHGDDIQQMLKMLAAGRVDAVIHTKGTALHYVNKLNLFNKIRLVDDAITQRRGGYMSLTKMMPDEERTPLRLALEQAMLAMKADGTLTALRASYYKPL